MLKCPDRLVEVPVSLGVHINACPRSCVTENSPFTFFKRIADLAAQRIFKEMAVVSLDADLCI